MPAPATPRAPHPPDTPDTYVTARSDAESPHYWSPSPRKARDAAVAVVSPPSPVSSSVGSDDGLDRAMWRLSLPGEGKEEEEERSLSPEHAAPSPSPPAPLPSPPPSNACATGALPPRRPLAPSAAANGAEVAPSAPVDPYALPPTTTELLLISDGSDGDTVEVGVADGEPRRGARRAPRGRGGAGASDSDSDFVVSDGASGSDDDESMQAGPAAGDAACPRSPATARGAAAFRRARGAATAALFTHYNATVFRGLLPADLPIAWSPRLRSTAGVTHFLRARTAPARMEGAPPPSPRLCRVELSAKVVDSTPRLEATLLHELCHAAAWLVDGVARPPHGAAFRRWAAAAAAALPGAAPVTTCHSYAVHAPHTWRCAGGGVTGGDGKGCGRTYSRHSKSIDAARHACGWCRGRLAYVGRLDADGTPLGVGGRGGGLRRAPTGFALFVQARFAAARAAAPPGTSQADVMRALGAAWRVEKEARERAAA